MTPDEVAAAQRTLEGCQLHRGWIVGAYSQVEFLLGDLSLRAYELPAYAALKKPISMGVDNRMKDLRAVLALDGPMTPYRGLLETLLARLTRLERLRHFLSHGMLKYELAPEGVEFVCFRRYLPPEKKGVAKLVELVLRPHELEELKDNWNQFASAFVKLSMNIYLDLDLEMRGPVAERLTYDGSF